MIETSNLTENSLQLRRTIKAPREKVFEAWTKPEIMKNWFSPSDTMLVPVAEVDLRVGGAYKVHMTSPDGDVYKVGGTYKEIQAPEKLVFTWQWEDSELEPSETLVTVELKEIPEGTELIFTHERFSSAEAAKEHNGGWTGCLERLQKLF